MRWLKISRIAIMTMAVLVTSFVPAFAKSQIAGTYYAGDGSLAQPYFQNNVTGLQVKVVPGTSAGQAEEEAGLQGPNNDLTFDWNAPGWKSTETSFGSQTTYYNPILGLSGDTTDAVRLNSAGTANAYLDVFKTSAGYYVYAQKQEWAQNNTWGLPVASGPGGSTVPVNPVGGGSTPTIKGQLFDNANAPIGNYMFDANGFQGNFDPVYWISNIQFGISVFAMYIALNFYQIGAGVHSLDGLITIALNILHQGFLRIAVPLLPLAILMLIGVFLWFGFIKKDLPSVFGRAVKTMAVFILIAVISSPQAINSGVVQKISQFPIAMGQFAGGLIEKVLEDAITQKTSSPLTGSVENQAWESIVLNEWISGEEGQNYSVSGTPETNLEAADAAWRQSLAEPLQGSNRNQVAHTLEGTTDGPEAFSSGNRFAVSTTSFFGNIGPVLYFLVIGLILLAAKILFIALVAAGAVTLPLELFPVTRSTTLALKWVQLMAMTLFVTFYLTVYSSFLVGLSNDVTTAIQDSGKFGGSLSSFFFLVQGIVYLAAIYIAWKIYKRMKPMQRIKTMTERAAKQGIPLGWGQRLTVEARRANQWEKRSVTKKTLGGSSDLDKKPAIKKPSIISRATDAAKTGVVSARAQAAASRASRDFDSSSDQANSTFHADESEVRRMSRDGDEWSETEFEYSNGDRTLEGEEQKRLADGGDTDYSSTRSLVGGGPQSSREFERMDSGMDDDPFFASDQKDPMEKVIDIEPLGIDDKSTEWLKQANAQKQVRAVPAVRRGDRPANSPVADESKDTMVAIDKWAARAERAAGMVKSAANTMRLPDAVVDAMMGATLGKVADKVADRGNKAAMATIKHWAKNHETWRILKENRPAEVKRQTDPASKRSRAKVETPKDTTSWYGEWQKQSRQQDQPVEPTSQARPEKPAHSEPTVPRPRLTSGGSSTKPATAPIKPAPVMRMKGATVTQIRNAQNRSQESRVKRLAKYTQPERPKIQKPNRPNLRKKNSPSLADRIFGGDRR